MGVHHFLGKAAADLYPITVMLSYLVVRGPVKGPLFCFKDGGLSTQQRLVGAVRQALIKAEIDQAKYNGYSFRIGASIMAMSNGLDISFIKTQG